MALSKEAREYFAKEGRKGGQLRAQRMTQAERSDAARKAVQARWAKLDKQHEETAKVIAEGTKKLKKLTAKIERQKAGAKKKSKE